MGKAVTDKSDPIKKVAPVGKSGGKAKADGIAVKGKTKGKMY